MPGLTGLVILLAVTVVSVIKFHLQHSWLGSGCHPVAFRVYRLLHQAALFIDAHYISSGSLLNMYDDCSEKRRPETINS